MSHLSKEQGPKNGKGEEKSKRGGTKEPQSRREEGNQALKGGAPLEKRENVFQTTNGGRRDKATKIQVSAL